MQFTYRCSINGSKAVYDGRKIPDRNIIKCLNMKVGIVFAPDLQKIIKKL